MSNDQDNKKAIAMHGNGFYSYSSLLNYTIFAGKSTGNRYFTSFSAVIHNIF